MPYVVANSETGRVPFPRISPASPPSPVDSPVTLSPGSSGLSTPTDSHGPDDRESRPRKKSSLKSGRPYRTPSPSRNGSPFRRTRSVPDSLAKLVHFPSQDADLQCVRTFSQSARPMAISNHGSDDEEESSEEEDDGPVTPDSTKYRIDPTRSLLPNARVSSDGIVKLDAIEFSHDSALRGRVRVRNVAYHKSITARFSLDNWESTSEVSATYMSSSPCDMWETWTFTVRLEDIVLRNRVLSLCVHYVAGGAGEWWDNNNQNDYTCVFTPIRDVFIPPKLNWGVGQTTRRRSATVGESTPIQSTALPRTRGTGWHDWAQNNSFRVEKPDQPTHRSRPLFVI